MIKQEIIKMNGKDFVKTYSDSGFYIKQLQTNGLYDIAYDVLPLRFTYIESNEKIIEADEEELSIEEE